MYVASRENGQVLSFSIDKLQVSRAGGVYNRGQRPCCSLSLTPLSRLDSPIGQGHCRPSLRWPRLVVAHQAKWRYLGPDLGQRRQGAPCCLLHPYGICTFFIGRETLLPTPLSPSRPSSSTCSLLMSSGSCPMTSTTRQVLTVVSPKNMHTKSAHCSSSNPTQLRVKLHRTDALKPPPRLPPSLDAVPPRGGVGPCAARP